MVLLIIPTSNGGLLFSLFYTLAFIIAGSLWIHAGRRKAYPAGTWFIVSLFLIFCVILGDKLLTTTPQEWHQYLQDFHLPHTGKKSVLGAIIGLSTGLFLLRYVFRYRFSMADRLAYILPITIAVARLGCLFAGCCYGNPSELPWSVHYGHGSIPFEMQVGQGLVSINDSCSLGVHPTQIYDIIFCLLTVVLIWITRKFWKARGSLLIFSVLCYASFRFIEEFFRASIPGNFFSESISGLKYVQWIILGGILLLGVLLIIREKYGFHFSLQDAKPHENHLYELIMLTFIFGFFVSNINWFSITEKLLILIFLVPAISNYLYRIYTRYTVRAMRWIVPVLLIYGILTMGQSYITQDKSQKVTFTEIGIGGLISEYHEAVSQVVEPHGCYGDILSEPQMRNYNTSLGGLDLSYNIIKSKYKRFKFTGGGFFGNDHVTSDTTDLNANESTYGIHIAVNWDWKYVAYGAGFQLGKLKSTAGNKDPEKMETGDWENEMGEYVILPMQYLRLGPVDILYAEGMLMNFFPAGAPMPYYSFGLGSGLGKTNGTLVGAGYSDAGFYAKGAYSIKDRYLLEAYCSNNFKPGYDTKWLYSIGFFYKFNFKTLPLKVKKSKH